jgi:hypothetical protein
MPTHSDEGPGSDGGPLKKLSFFVLLALAVEIALLAWLGQAAA